MLSIGYSLCPLGAPVVEGYGLCGPYGLATGCTVSAYYGLQRVGTWGGMFPEYIIMAYCMCRLGEWVRPKYTLHGDIELPSHTLRYAVTEIYHESAHGAAQRRWRRDSDSP